MLPTDPMDSVCRFLRLEEERRSAAVHRARADLAAAVDSERAMQTFTTELWDHWHHVLDTHDLRHHDVAPLSLKAGFVDLFREHMPIMAGMRYAPSPDELNAVVDMLLRPVDWSTLDQIVEAATHNMSQIITNTSDIANRATHWLHSCQARHDEVSRLNYFFRSSCTRFWRGVD